MVEVWKLDLARIVETLTELTKATRELTEEVRLLRMEVEKLREISDVKKRCGDPPRVVEITTVEEEFGLTS